MRCLACGAEMRLVGSGVARGAAARSRIGRVANFVQRMMGVITSIGSCSIDETSE